MARVNSIPKSRDSPLTPGAKIHQLPKQPKTLPPDRMTANRLTSLARVPLLLIEYAEQSGLDCERLLRSTSLTTESLSDPDNRISVAALVKLWRAILEQDDGPAIGVRIGNTCQALRLGLVGYSMSYSRNLLEAYQRFSRYVHIISEAVQIEVVDDGEQTTITFDAHPSLFLLRHPVEAQVAATLAIGREITRSKLVPLAIRLPYPSPGELKTYREVFSCPVYFDQPGATIEFATSQLRLPISASDPTLSGYLEALANSTLEALGASDESFLDTVRRALWSELRGGKPNLWRTASALDISPRTLQRRLRDEGCSFSSLLDELRRELAGDLLADKNLGVADVAFLLGYSEPSAFQRAFRRWRGVSPRQFRSA